MKLDKAIELLQLDLNNPGSVAIEDLNEAQELGIEALKAVQRSRNDHTTLGCSILIGEDSFIDTTHSEHAIRKVLESPLGKELRP